MVFTYYIDDGSGFPKYYIGRNISEALAYVDRTYKVISYRGNQDGFTADCEKTVVECSKLVQRK